MTAIARGARGLIVLGVVLLLVAGLLALSSGRASAAPAHDPLTEWLVCHNKTSKLYFSSVPTGHAVYGGSAPNFTLDPHAEPGGHTNDEFYKPFNDKNNYEILNNGVPTGVFVGYWIGGGVCGLPALSPGLSITKSGALNLGGDGVANAGDVIEYTFTVENTGDIGLTLVGVSDSLVGSITCPSGNPIPTLAAGDSEICTGSYTTVQADFNDPSGQKSNLATATAANPLGGPDLVATDPHSEALPANPAVTLDKNGLLNLGADGVPNAGDVINYTFLVTNTGNITLNISITDTVAAVTCPAGASSLAPGVSVECTGSYTTDAGDFAAGSKSNTATATGTHSRGDPVTAQDTAVVPLAQDPRLSIDKDGSLNLGADGVPNAGDVINYTFLVTNTGNVTLTNVSVSDPLVGSITCPGGNPIPSLAPGGSKTCSGSYTTDQTDFDTGSRSNTATATAPAQATGGGDLVATDGHVVPLAQTPGIGLVKSGQWLDDGAVPGIPEVGETIRYTFGVTNTGNVTLNTVGVIDSLNFPVTCALTTLAPGAQTTCTGDYLIQNVDLVPPCQVDNTATASGLPPASQIPVTANAQARVQLPCGGGGGGGGGGGATTETTTTTTTTTTTVAGAEEPTTTVAGAEEPTTTTTAIPDPIDVLPNTGVPSLLLPLGVAGFGLLLIGLGVLLLAFRREGWSAG